ncbi:hypothetical protein QOT17_006987 [Balamuthia mandrillaris]
MSSSCKGIREELIACLKMSKCMRENGKTFHECLQSTDEDEIGDCKRVRTSYHMCKHNQVNMRKRIRGNNYH